MEPYANGNSFSPEDGKPSTLPPILFPPAMRDRDLPR
jgi:hypothetical protein